MELADEERKGATGHGEGLEDNVNYRYFVDFVRSRAESGSEPFRVLDFGCGHGSMVQMLRDQGLDAYGADVFYEGADWAGDPVLEALRKDGFVREIGDDGVIPFEDGFFDLVISNQVYEHVEHLDQVNAQLTRVLSSTGSMYHHFPSRSVLREGHIGIPFAHRMRPGRARTLYTRALRTVGFGKFKEENPTAAEWTDAKLDWIDQYCYYRPYDEIAATLGDGYELRHHEIDYCRFRAGARPLLGRLMRIGVLRKPLEWAFRRLGFMALEQRRVS